VSARHQVKRLDRISARVRSFENRSGRRNEFSSFGADPSKVRNFTSALVRQWDLVLTCSPTPSFPRGRVRPKAGVALAPALYFPQIPEAAVLIGDGLALALLSWQAASSASTVIRPPPGRRDAPLSRVTTAVGAGRSCRNGYRFAKPQGKPNFANALKPARGRHFCDFPAIDARATFTSRSSRYLNCPSNLIGHDHPNKPANGVGE
jgi:hypothetical protein